MFYGGNVVGELVHSFFTALIFTLHILVTASISHLSPPLQNFYVVLATKNMSPLFFFSFSRSLLPFFYLSFAGLPPTFSFSLSLSCSIFQIWGHENWSKLNTLDNSNTETIFAFRFRLHWLFSCLCFTRRRGGYAISRQNNLASCIWVAIPVDWVILHWFACGADGWAGTRAYGHVITKFYRMGRLLHFLTHGATLRTLRSRELC